MEKGLVPFFFLFIINCCLFLQRACKISGFRRFLRKTNDMKLRIIGLLAFVLLSACGKTEAQRQKDEVDTYMASLLEGKYESQLEMKLFDPAQIPNLLSYANDEREVHPPANPLSSYLSVSSLGMYALWMIEGIRVAEVDSEKTKVFMGYPSLNPLLFDEQTSGRVYYGTEAYPATQRKAADAYRAWWNSGSIESILSRDPLEFTGLHWY